MNNNFHFFGLGFYLLCWVIKNICKSYNEDSSTEKTNIMQENLVEMNMNTKQFMKAKTHLYYLDNTLLQHKHETVYLKMLGIVQQEAITQKIIIEAYYNTILNQLVEDDNCVFLLTQNDKEEVAKAACDYLIDRCNYLGFEN